MFRINIERTELSWKNFGLPLSGIHRSLFSDVRDKKYYWTKRSMYPWVWFLSYLLLLVGLSTFTGTKQLEKEPKLPKKQSILRKKASFLLIKISRVITTPWQQMFLTEIHKIQLLIVEKFAPKNTSFPSIASTVFYLENGFQTMVIEYLLQFTKTMP